MKILIVEDESDLLQNIHAYLTAEGYRCELATTYKLAVDKVIDSQYDCVLLDLSLPDGNGFELIKIIKESKRNDGIIVISANNALNDKIIGLKLGADDYLAKPFHLSELSARLYAVIRRKNFNGSAIFEYLELRIHTDDQEVFVKDKPVLLSKKELDLLLFLVTNKNKTVSRSAIAAHLSQDDAGYYRGFDVIYAHMKNLKRKLAEAGCKDYIKTIYKIGYKFDCHEIAG
jgi:DNA-binding response OmpR family regulator